MEASTLCTARSPIEFSRHDWWNIIKATYREVLQDKVFILAGGVAFFSMLAIFPLITFSLSIFGLVSDPTLVQEQLFSVSAIIPADAWSILNTQIMSVVEAPDTSLGWGLVFGLLLALWSAGAGIRAIMQAMNIAYEERESRKVVVQQGLATLLTVSVLAFLALALLVILGVPALLVFLRLEGPAAAITSVLPWTVLIVMFSIATAILYRVGPSRRMAKWRWVWPGVIFSSLSWILISIGFSNFVGRFGTYNQTYGSLSAAIILLMWFWLTSYVIIVGAELNAEMEKHTGADTTRGYDRPAGERGAVVADYKIQ